MTSEHRFIPICFPATATGDLWHNAVAQICWQEFGALNPQHQDHRLVSVFVVVVENIEDVKWRVRIQRNTLAYDLMRALDLPVVLARWIGKRTSPVDGYEDMRFALRRVGVEDWEKVFSACGTPKTRQILQIGWENAGMIREHFQDLWLTSPLLNEARSCAPVWNPLPVDGYTATTIVCSYLHSGISPELRRSRIGVISDRICSAASEAIFEEVETKIQDLRALAERQQLNVNSSGSIILFIYRKGLEFAQQNRHLDSSMRIFEQVQRVAAIYGKIVLRVPHGLHRDELLPDDFDLFDIAESAPLKDKSFTAIFWKQALSMPEIFGVIGGRSGSLDIAAFIGHNCFGFDEPLLDVLCSPETENRYDSDYVVEQVPQHFRFLQQCSIMSIGLLDLASWQEPSRTYVALGEQPFRLWLERKDGIRPTLPVTTRAFRYLESACVTHLERPDLGVFAVDLREMWRESVQKQVQFKAA